MKDIEVTYLDSDNRLVIGFNGGVNTVEGKDWIVQKIIKAVLTDVGSNVYDIDYGSRFNGLIGRPHNTETSGLLKSELVQTISKVEADIKKYQSTQSNIPAADTLVAIEIDGIIYDKTSYSYELQLLVTMANRNVFNLKV